MTSPGSNRHAVVSLAMVLLASLAGCDEAVEPPGQRQDTRGQHRGPQPLDELRAQFEAYLETMNTCAADDECTVIAPGCPLGCFAAVPAARRQEVEDRARSMIAAFGAGGPICVYNCPAHGAASCSDRRCTARPVPGPVGP